MTPLALILPVTLLCAPLWAGEYVVLSTGFRVYAERHETIGDKVVVHTRDGSLEFAASTVSEYQPEEKASPIWPEPNCLA